MVAVVDGKFLSDATEGPRVFDNPVLVVRNMQNGLLLDSFDREDLIYNLRDLITVARRNAVPVIYSQHHNLPTRWTEHRRRERPLRNDGSGDDSWMRMGTPEWQIVSLVKPEPDDMVLPSHTESLFSGTPLEQLLRQHSIHTLILAGLSSDSGILVTARKALMLGFAVVIPEDALGGKAFEDHMEALNMLDQGCEVISTSDTIARLDRHSIRNVLPPALLGWKDPARSAAAMNGPLAWMRPQV